MSATEQYFPIVLFFAVVLTFSSVDESLSIIIQVTAIEQCVLYCSTFFMLYKLILTFQSVDEILKYDYSDESY